MRIPCSLTRAPCGCPAARGGRPWSAAARAGRRAWADPASARSGIRLARENTARAQLPRRVHLAGAWWHAGAALGPGCSKAMLGSGESYNLCDHQHTHSVEHELKRAGLLT